MICKELREERGLTQKEFADKLGLDQSTVSLWENGKTQPRTKLLVKIARILGCTVEELVSDPSQEG